MACLAHAGCGGGVIKSLNICSRVHQIVNYKQSSGGVALRKSLIKQMIVRLARNLILTGRSIG